MERTLRPDKVHAYNIIKTAQKTIRDTDKILLNIEKKHSTIINAFKTLTEETIRNTLSSIPVERLRETGQGLRLGAIANSSVKNVVDILRMSKQQLTSFRGVGEQTANQIMAAAQNLEKSIRESIRIRLDPDKPTTTSTQLVSALYGIIINKDDIDACSRIMNNNRSQVLANIKLAKRTKNAILWFFTREKTKSLSIDALGQLEAFFKGQDGEELVRIIHDYTQTTPDADKAWNHFLENSPVYYAALEKITGGKTNNQQMMGNLPSDIVERVEALDLNYSLIRSSLRGYQAFGAKYMLVQEQTLIGDEMGLGKTVEAIAAMAHLKAEGARYFEVVCPASVLINWCREIELHSSLKAYKLHAVDRENQLAEWAKNGGVAVTTYETLRAIDLPDKIMLDMLVADEAHYVKNPEAQRTRALIKILPRANRTVFMTGTPLENRLKEMLNLIGYLKPEVANNLSATDYLASSEQFRQSIASVYLRRNRDDVLNELPELIQMEEWVDLGLEEARHYMEAVKERNFMRMRRVAWTGNDPTASPKLERLLEICEDAEENNRKVIIFSFFHDVINKVSQTLGKKTFEPITGGVTPVRRQAIIDEFSKAPAGATLVCQIQAGGVGLNIQAASVVILCEPQIKPALETQAISRAYRMGQTRKVVVHRLLTENSVDERIMEILGNKQQLFDLYARDSVITETSPQAVDITEKALIDRIMEQEQKRLGLTTS